MVFLFSSFLFLLVDPGTSCFLFPYSLGILLPFPILNARSCFSLILPTVAFFKKYACLYMFMMVTNCVIAVRTVYSSFLSYSFENPLKAIYTHHGIRPCKRDSNCLFLLPSYSSYLKIL